MTYPKDLSGIFDSVKLG